MRCCGPKEEKTGPKPLSDRRCTDILILILFALFWGGLVAIFTVVWSTGDTVSLFYDADYLGNRCGVGALKNRTKAYYPRMADDLLEQRAYLQAGAVWNIQLYTLCVEACPQEFSIESPTIIHDYGYHKGSEATTALGERTRAEWVSILPTYDVLNRCVPYTDATSVEQERCAYPNCTAEEAVGLGAVCADAPAPAGGASSTVSSGGEWEMTSGAQRAACIVKVTKLQGAVYKMQTDDEISGASDTLLRYIAQAAGFLNDLVASLQESRLYLVGFGLLLPVVLSFGYALFLRFFASAAVHLMIIVLLLSMVGVTVLCYVKAGLELGGVSTDAILAKVQNRTGLSKGSFTPSDPTLAALVGVEAGDTWLYELGFWLMAVLTLVATALVLAWRKQLRMAIAIVQEACAVFRTMPSLMLFPFTTVALVVPVCLFFFLGAFLLVTSQPETLLEKVAALNATLTSLGESERMEEYSSGSAADEARAVGSSLSDAALTKLAAADGETLMRAMAVYWFFGLLWTVQFVQACSWTTMSGAVVYWFFFRKDPKERTNVPILRSAARVARYHLGSMAFGALVIALCQLVRVMLEHLDRQTRQAQGMNAMLKMTIKCLKCCLWCFEKTVRFVTGYGFVYIAMEGSSFCSACFKTFSLILGNPAQVAVNTVVSSLLTLLAVVAIPVLCAAGAYFYFDHVMHMRSPMYPTFFVLLLSAVVAQCCASVFNCTISTLFVSCLRDNALYQGEHMPEQLRKAFGIQRAAGVGEAAALKGSKAVQGKAETTDAELES